MTADSKTNAKSKAGVACGEKLVTKYRYADRPICHLGKSTTSTRPFVLMSIFLYMLGCEAQGREGCNNEPQI